jgi:hypothetical protein
MSPEWVTGPEQCKSSGSISTFSLWTGLAKWIQHVNRMPRNRSPTDKQNYTPKNKMNQGRPLKRLLDVCETGTGQQVAQLLDSYMMMLLLMMMMIMII